MGSMKQGNFSAGEIDPSLHARSDLAKTHAGMKTCRNFIVRPQGGVQNRPGTKLVREVKNSDNFTRLIPFVFSEDQAYILELGDGYVRFHQNGGTILGPSGQHDGGDAEAVLTDFGENWPIDLWVGATITNETNGETATVTANTGTTITGVLSGGESWDVDDVYSLDAVYEIESPYATALLSRLKHAQMADVMTIVNQEYHPYELKRYAADKWALAALNLSKPVNPPTGLTVTVTWDTPPPASRKWEWVATSVDENGIESQPGTVVTEAGAVLYDESTKPVLTLTPPASGNTPVSYNWYRGSNGVYGYVGSSKNTTDGSYVDDARVPDYGDAPPQATDPFNTLTDVADDPIPREVSVWVGDITDKNTTPEAFDDRYTYQYQVILAAFELMTVEVRYNDAGTGAPGTLKESIGYGGGVSGKTYNVSKAYTIDGMGLNDEFILTVASSTGSPTLNRQKVTWVEEAAAVEKGVANFPAVVCFFEQRRAFLGFSQNTQRLLTSKTGQLSNFDISLPSKDDDSVDLTIASLRIDEIRNVIPLGALMIFTAGAEWVGGGAQGGPLTPRSFDLKPRTYHGSMWPDPLAIGEAALFVRSPGTGLIELTSDQYYNKYSTNDLTILAGHLFDGYTIVELAYAQAPNRVVWALRSDGTLLGMTYAREHEVWAWHRHETEGTVESICTVPESGEDILYMVVNRDNGRYIERMSSRYFTDLDDAVFLDSALSFNGTNTGTDAIKAHLPADSYAIGSAVTLEATVGTPFVLGDVDDFIELTAGGVTSKFRVYEYTDSNTVLAEVMTEVPAGLQDTAVTDWAWLRDTFSGLAHLNGSTIKAVCDGAVASEAVVSAGSVTLDTHGKRVLIGLPYQSLVETLDHQTTDGGVIDDKRKVATSVTLKVVSSRGIQAADSTGQFRESPLREPQDGWGVQGLKTGSIEILLSAGYKIDGGIKFKQDDPLPLEVIAAIPKVEVQ